MLVKWKILCSFGLVFWLTMCVIDYGFGTIINKGEFNRANFEDDDEEELGPLAWKQVATWGMLSFIASFLMCVFLKIFNQIMYKLSNETIENPEVAMPSNTTIELRETAKSSGFCLKFQPTIAEKDNVIPNLNLLEAVKDFPVTTERSSNDMTTKLVEKRCAKLKEEMREMNMNTWKEYSNFNKKLDTLAKEKFDMGKQIGQLTKDNRALKQQLDDIISDRALLLKRLEVATKEIKLNSAAKQMTLDKLQEAMECSNQMKSKVVLLNEEKKRLEGKCEDLNEKYGMLKEQVRINLENKLRNEIKAKDIKNEAELEQSEKDIEKVQNKLLDLENSLKIMRSKTATESTQADVNNNVPAESMVEKLDANPDEQQQYPQVDECELENTATKIPIDVLKGDNKTMDQLQQESSDSDEHSRGVIRNLTHRLHDDKAISTTKFWRPSLDARTISMTDSTITTATSRSEEDSAISVEDSESETMYPPGIVSQSPAFQKFLLKVLESPVV